MTSTDSSPAPSSSQCIRGLVVSCIEAPEPSTTTTTSTTTTSTTAQKRRAGDFENPVQNLAVCSRYACSVKYPKVAEVIPIEPVSKMSQVAG